MIISLKEIINKIEFTPKGVIHIGAYQGEEVSIYEENNIKNCIFIEANPDLFPQLFKNVGKKYHAVQALVSNRSGDTIDFHKIYSEDLTNKGCSSIFSLKKHAELYPMIREVNSIKLTTTTLDDI